MATKLKKNGKISVGDFEKAAMGEYVPTTTIEWRGLTIDVKKTLSLDEMVAFTQNVVRSCFDAERTSYHPEMKDMAVRSILLGFYTNLTLPSGLNRLYDILYCTDIVDMVYSTINQKQFEVMMIAVDNQIDYIANSNIESVTKQVNAMSDMIEGLGEKFKGVFDGVSPDDIKKTLSAIGEGGIDEGKLIQAYLDKTKKDGE